MPSKHLTAITHIRGVIFLVSKNFYKDSKQCANIKMQFRKKFIFIPHGISWSREPRLFQCVSPESKLFTFLRSYRNYHISHEIKVFHIGIQFLHIVLHQGNIFCFVSYENQIVTITVMTLIKGSLNRPINDLHAQVWIRDEVKNYRFFFP